MTFKQEFINRNSPFPFNFHQQRSTVYQKILDLIRSIHPNEWNIRSLQPLSLIQSFKQIYGLKQKQLIEIINMLMLYLQQDNITCQGNISIMNVLVNIRLYRIDIKDGCKINNMFFINKMEELSQNGIPYALKNSDTYMENMIKIIKIYCRFGEQQYDRIIQLAIRKRDIKYIAIFIKSIKNEQNAQKILDYIFQQSSIFQRDISFFYIIAQLTLQFPCLNIDKYYRTLSQQIIKIITTILDPLTQQELKKINSDDPCIGVPCTLKSIARILINCLKNTNQNGWEKYWSAIQRIFSIIAGIFDHTHQVQSLDDFLVFMKEFVKIFLNRYWKEKGLYKQVNQDYIQQYKTQIPKITVIDEKYIQLFNKIWIPIIPQLLYLQDGEVRAAKLLSDLAIFNPKKYLSYILQQIKQYLQKDMTIYSSYTPKMTILFLQQFIVNNYLQQSQFTLLIQCCQALLDNLQKVGIAENLDYLELVIRVYMYLPQKCLQEKPFLQSLTQDIIEIIENNLQPMSINLQSTQGDQAQLYIDFKNIYFNFIIRLNSQQIKLMSDKMLYKIMSAVPDHKQAYQFVIMSLCYVDAEFPGKILDFLYKNIVTSTQNNNNHKNGSNNNIKSKQESKSKALAQSLFPSHLNYSLLTYNQQHLKWYSSLLQNAFQYHPQNIIKYWNKLQIIITLFLRQFDNSTIFDQGLDIIFNIILNLSHIHLEYTQFFKDSNRKYTTLNNINWIHPSLECIGLLEYIKKKFYTDLGDFMQARYTKILQKSQKAKKIQSQKMYQIYIDKTQLITGPRPIQIKQFVNQIIDNLLVTNVPSIQDIEQKKYITKILSIQYSVFSALQMRAQFTSKQDLFEIQPFFIKELGNMRKHAVLYLKWILQILTHYNCLYDPQILKVFHFYWRQAHDELYFSAGIQATNDKLIPFFYPTQYKKKQIFQNSFLIMTECYVTFMMRIQLFSLLKPMAILNNPQYLQYQVPFAFSSALDCKFHSYIPLQINIHQDYHFQILNISRHKISLYNSNSYIRKYIIYSKAGNEGINKIEKQKYLGAIRVIINNFKRIMSIFTYPCCMKDQNIWYSLQQILQVSQYLQNKGDKVIIIQVIYLIVVFSFDFWGKYLYNTNFKQVQRGQIQFSNEDKIILKKVIDYVKFLIVKINSQIIKKFFEKDTTVLTLLLICFSQFIPLQHQIYQQIIPLAFQITLKNNLDLMNLGKTFIFRLLNRYIKKKQQIQTSQNTPVKRSLQQFFIYRHTGGRLIQGTVQPAPNLMTTKSDNYYYPLKTLQYLYRTSLDSHKPNQALFLQKITNQQLLTQIFKAIACDTQLKVVQSQVDTSYLNEQQPKKIYSNGHKLINYIVDSNPKNLDIFLSFIDNFSNYPICFYHRLFRKMMVMGGDKTISILQKIVKKYIKSEQKQQVKLSQFLLVQILPFCINDKQYYNFYTNFLVKCNKQQFEFANSCLLVVFCIDWRISKLIFNKIIQKLRQQKGPSRLRHLQIFNNYVLCTARYAREQAKNGIVYLMKGIQQGTDQVSELIISMLIYCFILPINLKQMRKWIKQQQLQLILNNKNKIYKLDENTGYNIDESVRLIIKQIILKTCQQKHMQSKNLKIYSNIAYKILSNITVYRFNDEFYNLFKQFMQYIVNKPLQQEGGIDQDIVNQLKNSQYPQNIYQDLISWLNNMEDNTINVIKKKLKFIQNVVINRSYCRNFVDIPDIFASVPEKNITIDHIVAASNMARLMKAQELTKQVQILLNTENKNTKVLNFMMAYLLAAGTRDFEWRENLLNQILSFKKYKIVKQFVSYWWKGRSPQTEKQQRLCLLVRSVENPYSYFA